jgi:putative glutamine amidotransferase
VRPLVAVAAARLSPGRVAGWSDGAEATPWQYLDGLRRAGLIPVVVAPAGGDEPAEIMAVFAGLVLTGGADVEPHRYGAEAHPSVYGLDAERDEREISLARHCVDAGVPLLAICRGIQVLNVALGGTLEQHLPDRGLPVAHGRPAGDAEPAVHPVGVVAGSRLAKACGGADVLEGCVSIHHQAVDRLAPGLVATGHSADGVVEAAETPAGAPWCLAVQWHPERSAASDPAQQAVFDAFAGAVTAGR